MSISIAQGKTSLKKYAEQMFSLSPSAIIYLYEIDVTNLLFDQGKTLENDLKIFRFHNHIKLSNTSIFFDGQEYIAAPITAEGFEYKTKGPLPTPRLAITVTEDSINVLNVLKDALNKLGDLAGAKVTRKRTFAKYLDSKNFESNQTPEGFDPDTAVFSKDVFFIDRKSTENQVAIEFELASVLDTEGVKLPLRRVLAKRCTWSYRGEGCMYEYVQNRVTATHGSSSNGALPDSAPAIANDKDELIQDIIGSGYPIIYIGEWSPIQTYQIGHHVFIKKDGIKYHFVATASNINKPPPNTTYWVADSCSRLISGCKLRWGSTGSVSGGTTSEGNVITKGDLRTSAYPAADRVS